MCLGRIQAGEIGRFGPNGREGLGIEGERIIHGCEPYHVSPDGGAVPGASVPGMPPSPAPASKVDKGRVRPAPQSIPSARGRGSRLSASAGLPLHHPDERGRTETSLPDAASRIREGEVCGRRVAGRDPFGIGVCPAGPARSDRERSGSVPGGRADMTRDRRHSGSRPGRPPLRHAPRGSPSVSRTTFPSVPGGDCGLGAVPSEANPVRSPTDRGTLRR